MQDVSNSVLRIVLRIAYSNTNRFKFAMATVYVRSYLYHEIADKVFPLFFSVKLYTPTGFYQGNFLFQYMDQRTQS